MRRRQLINNLALHQNDHMEPLEQKIARWMSRSKTTSGLGGYFKFLRLYGKIMSRQQAMFLQDLMNRAEICRTRTLELAELAIKGRKRKKPPMGEDGFFRCSVLYLLNPEYDSWTKDEQKEHIRFLREKGLIWTQARRTRRGTIRWVKINYVKVEEELDRAEGIRLRQMGEFYGDPHNWKKPKLPRDQ